MSFRSTLALVWLSIPAFAQFAGPAILSRGEAPSGMQAAAVPFQPFAQISGLYSTGLTAAAVDERGNIGSSSSIGTSLSWGVSGSHRWVHSTLGLNYRGSLNHYARKSYYDNLNQSLMIGFDHQLTRRMAISVRENAGVFTRDHGIFGLSQTVPFDPGETSVPRTDYFDNRTIYLYTQGNLTFQKSRRMSVNLSGGNMYTNRRSKSLSGLQGMIATGDVQYRLSQRRTIGANYSYNHYGYRNVDANSDIHGAAATYSQAFTRRLEFSMYAGFMRAENKYTQTTAVDPVIAALLGITATSQIVHNVRTIPNVSARLTRTFSTGVLFVSAGRTVLPGNGLFLTSYANSVTGGYAYTGIRRWSFSGTARYFNAYTNVNTTGSYDTVAGGVSASRKIRGPFHLTLNYNVRKYMSGEFTTYNRFVQDARIGLGFSPGDVPLRIW